MTARTLSHYYMCTPVRARVDGAAHISAPLTFFSIAFCGYCPPLASLCNVTWPALYAKALGVVLEGNGIF